MSEAKDLTGVCRSPKVSREILRSAQNDNKGQLAVDRGVRWRHLAFAMDKFVVGLVQMRCGSDRALNLARAIEAIRGAHKQGAQVICLPELFQSLYFCQTEEHDFFDWAEPIPGPTTEVLAKLAGELKVVIVASLFERRTAGLYHNTAIVLNDDGTLVGRYRKMHIPDDPLYYEKFYFTPGDLGFQTFTTRFGQIGVLICWDQWFPEGARITALQGANILFYPTAIGWHPGEKAEFGEAQQQAWVTMQRAHAISNGVYVAACNRIGLEHTPNGPKEGIEFWGHSFVADPFGRIVTQAAQNETILLAECSIQHAESTRQHWPFLRDRRIDAYQPILKRHLSE